MEANGFPSTAITLIAALSSGLGLVINPLLGRLSDRGRRRLLLGVLYIVAALVLVITMYAHTASDFVIVAILLAFSGAERGISVALVDDFVPTHALSRCLALFEASFRQHNLTHGGQSSKKERRRNSYCGKGQGKQKWRRKDESCMHKTPSKMPAMTKARRHLLYTHGNTLMHMSGLPSEGPSEEPSEWREKCC